MTLTFGSLFAGIGGFDLGFERAGLKCKWQVEIDDYARRVLAKHWPAVRRWDDVRTWPQPDTPRVDVICGGFPCQDISLAGAGRGLDGERSGLWFEFARIIRELRPRIVVVENVSALTVRGLDRVLGAMASLGYDADWDCLPASDFGAPHRRDRIYIVGYASGQRRDARRHDHGSDDGTEFGSAGEHSGAMANSNGKRLEVRPQVERRAAKEAANTERTWMPIERCGWWESEPELGRVAHGIPCRVDRLRGLGNAVVPQVAEWIGRRIIAAVAVEDGP